MNPPARAQTNWTPFVFGCVAGIAPWIVVFTYFFGGGNYSQVNELQPVPRQSAIAPAAHKAHRCLATAKRTDASLPGADSGGQRRRLLEFRGFILRLTYCAAKTTTRSLDSSTGFYLVISCFSIRFRSIWCYSTVAMANGQSTGTWIAVDREPNPSLPLPAFLILTFE